MRFPYVIPVAASIVTAACGGEVPSAGDASRAELLTLDLLHEIGSIADADEALTRVQEATVMEGGPLLIAQPDDHYIRVHDVEGRFTHTIGGPGQGPGEIDDFASFGVDDSGVWVLDTGNGRLHRFDLDGELLSDRRWQGGYEIKDNGGLYVYGMGGVGLRVGPDGYAVAWPAWAVGPDSEDADWGRYPVRRLSPDGELLDTILASDLPFDQRAPEDRITSIGAGMLHEVARDANGVFWVDRSPSTAEAGAFRVGRVDATGDTIFDRSFAYEPLPVDRDFEVARMRARLSPETLERYQGIWTPEFYPPVRRLRASTDGLLWLAREVVDGLAERWGLDPESGEHVATLVLPEDESILDQAGDALVTLRTDEFDVPYVRRYRIR